MSTATFDLVLSVGPACRPAQQIKNANLRYLAAPLDWMELYPLETVLHLFQTGFSDFFLEVRELEGASGKHRRVLDVRNQVVSIHHFPADVSLEQGQQALRKTMLRRAGRIERILRRDCDVCLVGNRAEDPAALLAFLDAFSAIYPKARIVMRNVRDGAPRLMQTYGGGRLAEYTFPDVHPQGGELVWQGNSEAWQEMLRDIRLKKQRRWMRTMR